MAIEREREKWKAHTRHHACIKNMRVRVCVWTHGIHIEYSAFVAVCMWWGHFSAPNHFGCFEARQCSFKWLKHTKLLKHLNWVPFLHRMCTLIRIRKRFCSVFFALSHSLCLCILIPSFLAHLYGISMYLFYENWVS